MIILFAGSSKSDQRKTIGLAKGYLADYQKRKSKETWVLNEVMTVALTREFKETVMALCKDPEYRKGLLLEALESYLEGDIAVGNAMLRDYLNGIQAFQEIADEMQMKEAGVRRMVSPQGNATAKNLFRLFKLCQDREGIQSAEEFLRCVA